MLADGLTDADIEGEVLADGDTLALALADIEGEALAPSLFASITKCETVVVLFIGVTGL